MKGKCCRLVGAREWDGVQKRTYDFALSLYPALFLKHLNWSQDCGPELIGNDGLSVERCDPDSP